jgi:GNAT superfamily N-acetyltransferase
MSGNGAEVVSVVTLTDDPDPSARETILHALFALNQERAGPAHLRPLAVLLTEPTDARLLGGLWGWTAWGWLSVELLFVPERLRGRGIGSRLMRLAEEEALRRGCCGAWLDSFSFQAPAFYEKLGYSAFGSIPDYLPGQERYFMSRRLAVRA